jgi:hypothetical protein
VTAPTETTDRPFVLPRGADFDRLVDGLYAQFERKLRVERERRGG